MGEPTPTPTGQQPGSYADSFRGRSAHSEFADPCEIARQLKAPTISACSFKWQSMKCLDRNSYNKSKCVEFFQAYRDCKKTWLEQRREDRRAGKDVA